MDASMSSSRIQPMNFSTYGRMGSPAAVGRGATVQRNSNSSTNNHSKNRNYHYPSQASYSSRHPNHPEYYTSVQQPMTNKKSKVVNNSPQNRSPPVPSILTTAASFDSGITSTVGLSPERHGRTTPRQAPSTSASNRATPRSFAGPLLPPLSQHVPAYPSSRGIAAEGYSYQVGTSPPLTQSIPFGEIYYQHPTNSMPHGVTSDPYLHYHHAPRFNGPPHYYPYGPPPPWHHLHQNTHESSSSLSSSHHFPPMVVSSSSVLSSTPITPVEYVTELRENDVLSGRGGATNSYRGNRAFRVLVKEYQEQYLKAKKRDKPAVASLIVETIRKRGGRFLRRDTSQFRRRPSRTPDGFDGGGGSGSMIQWVDIGDERAREKTCQALREGAPELRRLGHCGGGGSSSDTDHNRRPWDIKNRNDRSLSFGNDVDGDSGRREKAIISTEKIKDARLEPQRKRYEQDQYYWHGSPTDPHSRDHVETDSDVDDNTPEVRNGGGGDRHPVEEITFSDEEELPMLIRPWSRLLPDRPPVEPIGLHQLSVQDRDMYLRDFLPPDPRDEMSHHDMNSSGKYNVSRGGNNATNIRCHVETHNYHDLYNTNYDENPVAMKSHDGKDTEWSLVTAKM